MHGPVTWTLCKEKLRDWKSDLNYGFEELGLRKDTFKKSTKGIKKW